MRSPSSFSGLYPPPLLLLMLMLMRVLSLAGVDARKDQYCPNMTRPQQTNFTYTRCESFYKAPGSPIRGSRDTDRTKLGYIERSFDGGLIFKDRKSKDWKLEPSVALFVLQSFEDYSERIQMLWKATMNEGTVIRAQPVVYVPYTSVLNRLGNTRFVGHVVNYSPTDELPKEVKVIWSFYSTAEIRGRGKRGAVLRGRFENLLQDSWHDGECVPGLCSLDLSQTKSTTMKTCDYYTDLFGTTGDLLLYWDPNMHAPGDSEMVVEFSSGVSYMDHFYQLSELLTVVEFSSGVSYMDHFYQLSELLTVSPILRKEYSFGIHGNPVDTPYRVSGNFTKVRSEDLPLGYC
eukprot:gene23148-30351_t